MNKFNTFTLRLNAYSQSLQQLDCRPFITYCPIYLCPVSSSINAEFHMEVQVSDQAL